MSVICFSSEEIGHIAESVQFKNRQYGRQGQYWKFLTFHDELEAKHCNPKVDMCEYADHKIACWMDRLYIANQIAFLYTYNSEKDMKIDRLDEKHIVGLPLPGKQLLEKLSSLRYNLQSNSGHSFVSQEDAERLERLINGLKDEIIRIREDKI